MLVSDHAYIQVYGVCMCGCLDYSHAAHVFVCTYVPSVVGKGTPPQSDAVCPVLNKHCQPALHGQQGECVVPVDEWVVLML